MNRSKVLTLVKDVKKMEYTEWKNELVKEFTKWGFPRNVAMQKANNFTGLWWDKEKYIEPSHVVEQAMKRGTNSSELKLYKMR